MAKILLVEKEIQLAESVTQWLTSEGHSLQLVNSGFAGWQKLSSNECELAIFDCDLPDLNGLDMVKRYRSAGGSTPIILLSDRPSPEQEELCLDSGANDYLAKPFHIKQLSARIRAVLRNKATIQSVSKPLGQGNEGVLRKANLLGTTLASKYEFLEVLGEGGLGLVFKARHPHLGRLLAVKMLLSENTQAMLAARFEREAKALCMLDHPNIVHVHDFGITEHRQPYMVIEYIDGKDLDTILEEKDYIPLRPALDILVQVFDGLAHAHEMGVLHRDVKPGNVMLKRGAGKTTTAKILDFGLAKLTEPDQQNQIALTKAGQVFGSPPYMSPEQVRGKKMDERSDVYSAGCMMYELITGYSPFVANDAVQLMMMHLDDVAEPMSKARPELQLPQDLDWVVARAMEKDPNNRYQTMRDLKDEVQKLAFKLAVQASTSRK